MSEGTITCANPDCGTGLWDWNTSEVDSRYCDNCGDLFLSVCVNGDTPEDLWKLPEDMVSGDYIDLDQCGVCGCAIYRAELMDGIYYMVCVGSDFDDFPFDGCGTRYRTGFKPGRLLFW